MNEKQRCCESVRDRSGWYRCQCQRNAKVERDGKFYCKQHDPEQVKLRQENASRIWHEKWDNIRREEVKDTRIRKAYPLLVEALQKVRQKFEDCTLEYPDMEMVDKALEAAGERDRP